MTRNEIYKELQKILDWKIRGKLSSFRYDKRYEELMTLLSKVRSK